MLSRELLRMPRRGEAGLTVVPVADSTSGVDSAGEIVGKGKGTGISG